MVARPPVGGSGRCGRVPDVVVASPTSAIGGHDHRWAARAVPRTGAGSRCRSAGSALTVVGVGCVRSGPPPPGRRERGSPGWSSGTRSASGAPDAGPGRTGPCRSETAPQSANHNALMNDDQVGQTPILGREGLLRLVEVVERLRARARGEEGESSWTTGEDPGPTGGGQAVLGGAAGGQPPGGGAVAGGAGQPDGGSAGPRSRPGGGRHVGPGR
jgi:hypothetical protein